MLWAAVGAAALCLDLGTPADGWTQTATPRIQADFRDTPASRAARTVADWAVRENDSRGLPFIIVDKTTTEVFVFDRDGRLLGASAALLGLARGDDSAPGVGDMKLSDIAPRDRTTPAGRFVASLGYGLGPRDILWVDYQTALALHRTLAANSREHRLERLASSSPGDHRITFGCINVSAAFYDGIVRPAFKPMGGIVYILPEVKSIAEVFPIS
jgi:hypothetical protein